MPPSPRDFRRVYRDFGAYDWDEAKSDEVFAERDFDLAQASYIFPGWVLEREDTRDYGERRYQAIGEALGEVYFVVYTVRDQTCRIITAWVADDYDRSRYLEG